MHVTIVTLVMFNCFLVEEHLKYRKTLITYKCINGLSKLIMKGKEIHDLNTRNNKAMHIPQYKTVSGQRTFYYTAVILWNDLVKILKSCTERC